jgi:hypothetical protein
MRTRQEFHGPRRAGFVCRRGLAAAGLGMALLVGVSGAPLAQTADRVWADCELSPDTVNALLGHVGGLTSNNAGSQEVAFVVIYSISNDNNGQPVGTRDFTGPVICRNTAVVGIPTPAQQTDPIGTVDILDAASAFLLRYRDGGTLRNRLCHTVDSTTDCFLISKTAP